MLLNYVIIDIRSELWLNLMPLALRREQTQSRSTKVVS
jgi:hypothetical protein